ncbi:MAG: hypothetical protein II580_00365, partial [Bacteroidales bacterium]|nr:hypothetical protein [Bacteroidales bacterium]
MTKTKVWTKVLIAVLVLALAAGILALSVSLRARADEKVSIRLYVAASEATALNAAREWGYLGAEETFAASNTDKFFTTCYAAQNEINKASGFFRTALEAGEYGSADMTAEDFDFRIYILEDMEASAGVINGFLGFGTRIVINGKVPTFHVIGIDGPGGKPTVLLNSKATYCYLTNNMILDNVIVRGNSADQTRQSATVAKLSRVVASGVTLKVTNGAAIYNGKTEADDADATTLSVLACGSYFSNRVNDLNGGGVTNDYYGTGKIGEIILESGHYDDVAAFHCGKFGIRTTQVDEPGEDVFGNFGANAPVKNDVGATEFYHYDFNYGPADAYVTVGGSAEVVRLRAAVSGFQGGKQTTAHLTVAGGEVTEIYTGTTQVEKGASTSGGVTNTLNNLRQYFSTEFEMTGGEAGTFYGGSVHIYKPGYTSNVPKMEQSETYGDVTANIKGGTITGDVYGVYEFDGTNNSNPTNANNGVLMRGTYTLNFGTPGETAGPTVQGRILSGRARAVVGLGEDATTGVKINVYGGTYHEAHGAGRVVWAVEPELNLYGGTFDTVYGMGWQQGYPSSVGADKNANMTFTEPWSGRNGVGNFVGNVTVDGATITRVYGTRDSGTSSRSVKVALKSGTIGEVYALGEATATYGRDSTGAANTEFYWIELGAEGYDKATKPLTIGQYYGGGKTVQSDNYFLMNGWIVTRAYQNLVIDPDVLDGGYTGEFYAVGGRRNGTDPEGIYAGDIRLELYGTDLSDRTNDDLFGNVVLQGRKSTSYR